MKFLRINLKVKSYGLRAIFAAAYVLTDRSHVFFEGNPKSAITLNLRPKPDSGLSRDKLRKTFFAELSTQQLRWKLAEANQPLRERLIQEALRPRGAAEPAEAPAGGSHCVPEPVLSSNGDQTIDRLLDDIKKEITPCVSKKGDETR